MYSAFPQSERQGREGISARYRIFIAILILGAYAQIAQAILIREGLVVFYGNEISLGAFYGSWLFWIAVGSLLIFHWRDRPFVGQPQVWVRRLLLLTPAVLLLQVLLLRLVRLLLNVSSSEFVPLGELFLSLFLITTPGSLLLGLAFPLACKALHDDSLAATKTSTVRDVSWLYVADALGALSGGVLFTFVFIRWLGLAATLGLVALSLTFAAGLLLRGGVRRRWPELLLAAVGLLILLPPSSHWLGWQLDRLRFHTLHPRMELLDSLDTRYGHLELARLGEQVSVIRDGQISQSFPLPREVQQQAAYLMSQAEGARHLLVFGGSASGLVTELLRYPVDRIDLVEQDRRAYERILPWLSAADRKALKDPRLKVWFMDGRRFVNRWQGDHPFDLVLVLDATPSSAYSNRYFTREFYHRVHGEMTPDGVLCTSVSSASNYLGKTVGSFTGSVYLTLESVFPHIAIMPGDEHLYCAAAVAGRVVESPDELERRYLAIPLEQRPFDAASFYSLLPEENIRYVREQLQHSDSDLNTDERPVTYYLNMVLWGKFSASGLAEWLGELRRLGPWPYLLPLLLGVGLWLLRTALEGFQRPHMMRQSAALSLALLGLIAMAAQLVVLFSYQAHVGFIFERVALLNGLFMTGLALGAWLGQWQAGRGRPADALAAVLLLVVVAMGGMSPLLGWVGQATGDWQEPAYLALAAILGILTGSGFPLAVRITELEQRGVVRSSGLAQAADNLGGALGGALTGTLLVPLLGVRWSCYLLTLYALFALLPLLFARWAPERLPLFHRRGHTAFPWTSLGWVFSWLVLLAFGWTLMQPPGPAPRLQFDQQRLALVSGSSQFELRPDPFPWYLGSGGDAAPKTATLSTMAAAPGIQGYAGPINLLLSLDERGRLRGVRYVASNETPSYIEGLDHWLAGLAGIDLSREGLSPQRVDGLTGATVTSQAALAAIDRSAAAVGRVAFDRSFAPGTLGEGQTRAWYEPRFLVTLLLLLTFFPLYLSGSERGRLLYQAATLVILGLWFNSLLTEVDLVNLTLGRWPSLAENPQRWLLIGFVLVSSLLFGQVWCGYLCPFGALQEFISRSGHFLRLRRYPDRQLETRMRFIKFLLLALLLLAVFIDGDSRWARFNPMQYAFAGRWQGWALALLLLVLVAALFHYRFWCRYFCPFGAFLAFGNKLALLNRLAPKRRFEHCDLGVRDEFDIDCIRCNRCLTGRDTRLKPRRSPGRRG